MAEETKQTSSSTPVSRKKRPTLSEKVKKQAALIDALNIELDQKNQALAISDDHATLIDTLSSELKHMENRVGDTAEQNTLIEELTSKIQEIEVKLLGSSLKNKQVVAQNTVKKLRKNNSWYRNNWWWYWDDGCFRRCYLCNWTSLYQTF